MLFCFEEFLEGFFLLLPQPENFPGMLQECRRFFLLESCKELLMMMGGNFPFLCDGLGELIDLAEDFEELFLVAMLLFQLVYSLHHPGFLLGG